MASSCFGGADSKEKSASVAFLAEIFILGTGTDVLLWSRMGLLLLLLKLNTTLDSLREPSPAPVVEPRERCPFPRDIQIFYVFPNFKSAVCWRS